MAPSSTLSLFLTVLVFAGAQGATKNLDDACDPAADTCEDNTLQLACDALADSDVCKLQVDQTCNGANADKCVTGAACDTAGDSPTNMCKCSDGNTATASKICAPDSKFGGACTGGPDDKGTCDDDNALCSADPGTCGCKSGTTGVDGQGCTINANKFGGSCTADTADTKGSCEDANALCSATTGGTCSACKTGYTGTQGAGCTVTAGKVGGSCTTTGSAVNVKGTCDDTHALCPGSADGTCFCKTGYTGTDGAGCVVTANTFGGACTGGPDAKGTCVDANGVCSGATGTCGCKATYSGAVGASCVMDNQVGGTCSGSGKGTCTDTNALCTSFKCACKPGYDGSAGGTCTKIADNTFGGSCTTTTVNAKGTCVDANAECPALTGGFCTCKTNYDGYAGSGCALANKLGGKCTTMTKGTKGTCESAGAVCSMQVDGRCVMSGAKAVVASVTSLVLACIVCLLAIN